MNWFELTSRDVALAEVARELGTVPAAVCNSIHCSAARHVLTHVLSVSDRPRRVCEMRRPYQRHRQQ